MVKGMKMTSQRLNDLHILAHLFSQPSCRIDSTIIIILMKKNQVNHQGHTVNRYGSD